MSLGPAVQQDHHRAVRWADFGVADVEHAGVDMFERRRSPASAAGGWSGAQRLDSGVASAMAAPACDGPFDRFSDGFS